MKWEEEEEERRQEEIKQETARQQESLLEKVKKAEIAANYKGISFALILLLIYL